MSPAARPEPGAAAAPGWGARIATMAFSGIFMLGFGAGGLLAGVLPIALTLWRAAEVSGWQPVSAQVLEVKLEESRGSKGSSTYAVRARYAYRVNGRDLEGSRVGLLDWGYDNVGNWHHEWQARLEDARQREQPVAAWVDPKRPERALLDRRVRWGLMAFHTPFALLFTAVGVGAAVVFWRALTGRGGTASPGVKSSSGPAAAQGRRPGQPIGKGVLGRLDDAKGELRFRQVWIRVMGAVAGLVAFMLLPLLTSADGIVARLAIGAFATLGIVLALHLGSVQWRWQREGKRLQVSCHSWLLRRQWSLEPDDLVHIEHELAYTSRTQGGPTVHHHRLVARRRDGLQVRLTPALAHPEVARAVEAHLRQALGLPRR